MPDSSTCRGVFIHRECQQAGAAPALRTPEQVREFAMYTGLLDLSRSFHPSGCRQAGAAPALRTPEQVRESGVHRGLLDLSRSFHPQLPKEPSTWLSDGKTARSHRTCSAGCWTVAVRFLSHCDQMRSHAQTSFVGAGLHLHAQEIVPCLGVVSDLGQGLVPGWG